MKEDRSTGTLLKILVKEMYISLKIIFSLTLAIIITIQLNRMYGDMYVFSSSSFLHLYAIAFTFSAILFLTVLLLNIPQRLFCQKHKWGGLNG